MTAPPYSGGSISWLAEKYEIIYRKGWSYQSFTMGTRITYKLVLLHADADWAREVANAVRKAMRETILTDELLEVLTELPPSEDAYEGPVVVVYLADRRAANDEAVVRALATARAAAFSVIPIWHSGSVASEVIPDAIRRLNAVSWDDARSECLLAALEHLGIVENERKLFLSYRRIETERLAVQLAHGLSERRFDVFLDRFTVPPAEDFQERIDQELCDKAFVVLLESKSAIGSPWVQHEVAYALSHHVSVLALTLPDASPDGLLDVVDDAFRVRLSGADLKGGELTASALQSVIGTIEMTHARQIRRRRSQLFGSTQDWLQRAGYSVAAVADWAMLAERAATETEVYLVTARAPTPGDLRRVDALRSGVTSAGKEAEGIVVHHAVNQDSNKVALNDWIIGGRPLRTVALDSLPSELGL